MLPHVRRPHKTVQHVACNLCRFCITVCRRPARGVIYRQHGPGQVALRVCQRPDLPICVAAIEPGKQVLCVPTSSISPAEPRPCNTAARSCCSFAPSIGRPHLRASFRAAAMLASSSERSGNSDRRATRCSSLVGICQTGCQIARHPPVHVIGYSAPAPDHEFRRIGCSPSRSDPLSVLSCSTNISS